MRKLIFLCFLFSFGFRFFTLAQSYEIVLPPHLKVIFDEKEKGLDGSPWLTETWSPGIITLTSGKIIDGLKYRYNVYRNRLYFQYENSEYVVGSPDSVKQIIMDGKKFVYDSSDPKDKDKKRFLEVLVDGKATLYINYYPFMIPSNYNIALGSGSKNETVSTKESYLLKVGSNLVVVDKKGKIIPLTLVDKKKEITDFMKKEKISAKKRFDLEKVIRYYNSL